MAQDIESRIDADGVGRQLDRILSSKVFSTAKRSRMFLSYAVERSLASSVPKEFEIAVEVLGRGPDYDPDIDATVRVEAGRLRYRLREYYDTEGKADSIFIDIPKGGYGAVFLSREVSSSAPVPSPSREQPNGALNGPQEPALPAPEENRVQPLSQYGQSLPKPRLRQLGQMRSPRFWVAAAVGTALIALVAGIATWKIELRPNAAGRIRSLAVLPLRNLSGNANQEYFADGIWKWRRLYPFSVDPARRGKYP